MALAATALAGLVGPEPAKAVFPATDRLAGGDRFATAVEISKRSFPTGAPAVVVATGRAFPDALVGGPAAVALQAPVLLVEPDDVPQVVVDELARLNPQRVVLLGGEATVSAAVATRVGEAAGTGVERLFGPTRYDTAAVVSALTPPGPAAAFVATGTNYPDALAGAAAAGAAASPMLLVASDGVPVPVAAELSRLVPQEIVVLGGSDVVSDAVAAQLGAYAPVRRVAGGDRYGTAGVLAAASFPAADGATVATGEQYADALAAGPTAARAGDPVLLTPPSCAPPATIDYLRARGWPAITVVGGTVAVDSRAAALWPCTPPPDATLAPGVDFFRVTLPGPNVAHVLVVDRSQGAVLQSALATETLRGRETLASVARRTGALAALNGDYFLSDGRPVHAFATGGRLLFGPGNVENQFALDSTRPDVGYLGGPALQQTATVTETAASAPVARFNDGLPTAGELALFSVEAAGDPAPPVPGCSARLRPTGAPTIDGAGASAQDHEVVSAGCDAVPVPPAGDIVLSAPVDGTYAGFVDALQPGQHVTTTWQLRPDWTGVADTTGGNPMLVVDGQVTQELRESSGGPYSEVAPRSGVGLLGDGRVVLVALDGRQAGYSAGMTLRSFADVFVGLGAVTALNLDGGGSTSMAIDGVLANRPSDTAGERSVGTVLLVNPGQAAAPLSASFAPQGAGPSDAGLPPELDPASLGGLVTELLSRGVVLDDELTAVAELFDQQG